MMKKLRTTAASSLAVVALGVSTANAAILGDLTDGLLHVAPITGDWTLSVNAGDVITVIARRLDPVDIWSFVGIAPNAFCTGPLAGICLNGVTHGDDQLPPFVGGPFGDPRYTFTSPISGTLFIHVGRCCNAVDDELIDYNVIATGSTANVPEPTTMALLGLGIAGFGFSRRKKT